MILVCIGFITSVEVGAIVICGKFSVAIPPVLELVINIGVITCEVAGAVRVAERGRV